MRDYYLSRKTPEGWEPTYGDFVVYPQLSSDYQDTDGVGICHCFSKPPYLLLWVLCKGGWRKVPFLVQQCRPISQGDYPRTEHNVKFYRQYDKMMDVNLQAVV